MKKDLINKTINAVNLNVLRSDVIYREIMDAPIEKRDDIFRYKLMQPFKGKWDCYHIPLKPTTPGGYDIIMANSMLGNLAPTKVDEGWRERINLLSDDEFWQRCTSSIQRSFQGFLDAGIELPTKDYLFTVLLSNPESPYTIMSDGYSGDGGIPGYITGVMVPNEMTLSRLPVAMAHEVNHNVRFQFQKWHDDISLGEMIVSEGLAENYATHIYGEDQVGPWVSKTDLDTLNDYIKPLMVDALDVQGMAGITAYLYGDDMAKMQNYYPVGMPYCAGYACGYHLVRYYLQKTGKSIAEATVLSAEEILKEVEDFWTNKTVS